MSRRQSAILFILLCLSIGRVGAFVASSSSSTVPSFSSPTLTSKLKLAPTSISTSANKKSSKTTSLAASILSTPSSLRSPSNFLFSSNSIKRRIIDPSQSNSRITLLEPIGNGTFGQVYWARDDATGKTLVAKTARAATSNDERAERNAQSYLEIESFINSKLCPETTTARASTTPITPIKTTSTISSPSNKHKHNEKENNDREDDDDDDDQLESSINSKHDGRQHIAPYLGECIINGTTYLIWEEAGEYTLEDYIEMEGGWYQLAMDLGVIHDIDDGDIQNSASNYQINDAGEKQEIEVEEEECSKRKLHQAVAAEVLRQLLEGLAYCHSCGIVHRDIKPANILVDPKTKTLRLIDFGSACCMNSWTKHKLGYRGENKGVRSILYCAPEEFVNEEYPYAFDVYGVAVTWLQTILSEDDHCDYDEEGLQGGDGDSVKDESFSSSNSSDEKEKQSVHHHGLGSEEHLFQWRLAVRDFGHNLVAWEEYATLHNTLPYGWDSLFGSSRQGIQALRLLSNMMSYSPQLRMSASEALLGPYLNPGCDAFPPPELPPAMPWSIMSHVQRWKKDKEVHSWQDGECSIEDLFTEVVAVEVGWPLGLTLVSKAKEGRSARVEKSDGGVIVAAVEDGACASKLGIRSGDSMLAIGSIDVENASLEHVYEILDQWPKNKAIPLLLLRDSD